MDTRTFIYEINKAAEALDLIAPPQQADDDDDIDDLIASIDKSIKELDDRIVLIAIDKSPPISIKVGDFVVYNRNNGSGSRQMNGKVTEVLSDHFAKIDNVLVPRLCIVDKMNAGDAPAWEKTETTITANEALEYARRQELGKAEMVFRLFQGKLIHDHTDGVWYFWNGQNWQADAHGKTRVIVANELSSRFYKAASIVAKDVSEEDDSRLKTLAKAAASCRYRSSINNVLSFASGYLSITAEEWDINPYYLGVENGIIDLRTGGFRPARPDDYLKIIAPTEWLGLDEPAPLWEQSLREIFAGNDELISFVQRLLGHALVGNVTEHILPILCGEDGRNGKSLLLNILKHVLGDYVTPAAEEVLLSGKASPGAAMPFLAALQHVRLCYVSETNEGDRLNAGVVKQLTGGDQITAARKYGHPFTFEPRHTIFLITNHKPHAPSDDAAVWERVKLIEFTQRFVDDPTEENEHQADKKLFDKLINEASGILAWLVHGCLEWQEIGLAPPMCVNLATEEYRQSEDTLGQFVDECCILQDSLTIEAKAFYTAYNEWSKESGLKPMSSTIFGKRMKKRFHRKKTMANNIYIGVGLLATSIDQKTDELMEKWAEN